MDFNEYEQQASRTAPRTYEHLVEQGDRLEGMDLSLLHGAIGIASEAGEILDNIKAHVFYGKPLDTVNLVEELGDVLWFVNEAAFALGVSIEDVANANIDKLRARFGDKFEAERAVNRDTDNERKTLKTAFGTFFGTDSPVTMRQDVTNSASCSNCSSLALPLGSSHRCAVNGEPILSPESHHCPEWSPRGDTPVPAFNGTAGPEVQDVNGRP